MLRCLKYEVVEPKPAIEVFTPITNRMIKDRLEAAGALCIFDEWTAISIKDVIQLLTERRQVKQETSNH
jgi:hypothetical protein